VTEDEALRALRAAGGSDAAIIDSIIFESDGILSVGLSPNRFSHLEAHVRFTKSLRGKVITAGRILV
jgi:uncharacterized membrane protein YcaP (DUF421 family)